MASTRKKLFITILFYGLIAQLVEQPAVNRLVEGSSPPGAAISYIPCGCGGTGIRAALRMLFQMIVGSSPTDRTRYPLRLAWRRCRSHLSPGLTILSYQIIVCGYAAYADVVER